MPESHPCQIAKFVRHFAPPADYVLIWWNSPISGPGFPEAGASCHRGRWRICPVVVNAGSQCFRDSRTAWHLTSADAKERSTPLRGSQAVEGKLVKFSQHVCSSCKSCLRPAAPGLCLVRAELGEAQCQTAAPRAARALPFDNGAATAGTASRLKCSL